jgi:hypothetical protein
MRMLKYRSNDYQDIIDDSIEKSRQLINQTQISLPRGTDSKRQDRILRILLIFL